ncbi:MAG: DUF4340 domain-containing protein [Oliverpabstia sp.]|nr:DUF4340 domain-containing protein [Oliverpabstia sp.]
MKKKRGLFVWGGILLLGILMGVYMIVKGMNTEETDRKEEEKEEIAAVSEEEISSLTFQLEGKETTWSKKEDGWNLEEDEKFPVDSDKMSNLTSALESVKVSRKLENIENLKDYGLEKPANVVTIQKTDGTEEIIGIGDKNSSTEDTYVYIGQDVNTVYTVSADLSSIFSGSIYDFAKGEEYPVITAADITQIEVKKDKNAYTLFSDGKSSTSWTITDENGEREDADSTSVGTLQSTVAGFQFSKYYEYKCEDWSNYGLDDPKMILTVTYTEQTATEENSDTEEETSAEKKLILQVGNLAEDGNYYVRLGDSQEVHGMSRGAIQTLMDGKAFDYWNKGIEGISIGDLDHLDVTYNGKTYTLKRIVTEEKNESETEEDSGKETVTETKYYVNDEEVKSEEFMDFYRATLSMECQNRLEENIPKKEAELVLHYAGIDGKEITVSYMPRDASFYTVENQRGTYGIVNKMSVKELIEKFVILIP